MLELAYDKGFYKLVKHYIDFCKQDKYVFKVDNEKGIELERLLAKIKISLKLHKFHKLMELNGQYYNKTIMLDIQEKIKLL